MLTPKQIYCYERAIWGRNSAKSTAMLTLEQVDRYETEGYLVVPGVFAESEVSVLRDHFMQMRAEGPHAGDAPAYAPDADDPLARFPRLIHMHRWDEISLRWMLDRRLAIGMTELLGREPYAVQTMLYFKPPGARGQALHQDQYYLKVEPGTCMAAWMAIDRCDEENGCMRVVPGSHKLPVLCTIAADLGSSFTEITVPVPDSMEIVPVHMESGDVLFFNGSVIHGSYPNTTTDRFRRALIGHYLVGEAEKVAQWYHPVLRMDGTEVQLGASSGGGPCGVWAKRDGAAVVELAAG